MFLSTYFYPVIFEIIQNKWFSTKNKMLFDNDEI